jgi:betaine-aldehyde dehydrogenase
MVESAIETTPMLVGGQWSTAATGETIEARNPATGDLIGRFPRGAAQDVDRATSAAREAHRGWRSLDLLERASHVSRLADRVVECADELASLDVADNGSPIREMRNDAHLAAAQMRYFAGVAPQLRGETIATGHDRLDYTIAEPYGVVGRIIPFNHPLMFAAEKIAAPLIAGNTVVLKPSEQTSMSALRLAELIHEIFPPGVVNVVTGLGVEAGDALAAHADVRRLAFIGSVAVGLEIQRRAAIDAVKTVTLELGGKNPMVVCEDADLDLAVDGALRGMNFTWQGQSCGSTSRLLLQRPIHDAFVTRLAERMSTLRCGAPDDEATDVGAIVSRRQFEKVRRYIEIGQADGARLVCGGGSPDPMGVGEGLFVEPTLFDEVDPAGRLAQEEIFGPVLVAIPFDDLDEAVDIANSVDYGLTASIFSTNLRTAHRFARDVQAGYVWVNDASRHFLGAPYGGVKNSGIGREEGFEELESYVQFKNVNVNLG